MKHTAWDYYPAWGGLTRGYSCECENPYKKHAQHKPDEDDTDHSEAIRRLTCGDGTATTMCRHGIKQGGCDQCRCYANAVNQEGEVMPTEEEGQQALQANDAANAELQRYIEHKDEVLAALRAVTGHLADVMGGPMIAGAGIEFANGVEGIPTIAAARSVLRKVEGS